MKKKQLLTVGLLVGMMFLLIGNPAVLAKAKNGLAHMVGELDKRLTVLEKQFASIETSSNSEDEISEELKHNLLEEYEFVLENYTHFRGEELVTYANYQFVYEDGKNIFRVYVEGDYFWEQQLGDYSHNQALGMVDRLADTIIKTNTLYGANVKLEIYDDGVQVTDFASK